MDKTKIRWAGSTWNPMTGCSSVSPGCDNCYARTIAEKFGPPAFPRRFEPTYKPAKLAEPTRWAEPRRVFVNSMSDLHHPAFGPDQLDAVYDTMARVDRHDYLVLTKRPKRMASYIEGWLERRQLDMVPRHIWLGTSIELDRYGWWADALRRIPVLVRFISAEPLLGELPNLDLTGISWVIVGGESGPGWRPMLTDWARDLRDRCDTRRIAYFFKQSAAPRTEMGVTLDGRLHEEFPLPLPRQGDGARALGRYAA